MVDFRRMTIKELYEYHLSLSSDVETDHVISDEILEELLARALFGENDYYVREILAHRGRKCIDWWWA